MSFLYTHFKIKEKGNRVIVKINGSIAVLNQWYLSSDVITVEKENLNHYAEPYDYLKVQVKNNENESKENYITINFPPNKNISIISIPEEFSMINNQTINIFEHIQINDAVDRIRFIDFNNIGEFKIGNNLIKKMKTYYRYDFQNINFSSFNGNGNPYQIIKYQLGNSNGFDTTTECKININGLASLLKISEVDDNEDTFISHEALMKIENGYIGKIAKISININMNSPYWDGFTENGILVSYGDNEESFIENGVYERNVQLDDKGSFSFLIETNIENSSLPIIGNIIVNLLEIDGNSALISAANSQTINLNF